MKDLELKTGMYVRTCEYGIGKVEICKCSLCEERGYLEPRIVFENHVEYIMNEDEEIIYGKNASQNIIDLIEVGDYVNGYKVASDKNHFGGELSIIRVDSVNQVRRTTIKCLKQRNEIKSIVTKEQFAQMEYKIKELEMND